MHPTLVLLAVLTLAAGCLEPTTAPEAPAEPVLERSAEPEEAGPAEPDPAAPTEPQADPEPSPTSAPEPAAAPASRPAEPQPVIQALEGEVGFTMAAGVVDGDGRESAAVLIGWLPLEVEAGATELVATATWSADTPFEETLRLGLIVGDATGPDAELASVLGKSPLTLEHADPDGLPAEAKLVIVSTSCAVAPTEAQAGVDIVAAVEGTLTMPPAHGRAA